MKVDGTRSGDSAKSRQHTTRFEESTKSGERARSLQKGFFFSGENSGKARPKLLRLCVDDQRGEFYRGR